MSLQLAHGMQRGGWEHVRSSVEIAVVPQPRRLICSQGTLALAGILARMLKPLSATAKQSFLTLGGIGNALTIKPITRPLMDDASH